MCGCTILRALGHQAGGLAIVRTLRSHNTLYNFKVLFPPECDLTHRVRECALPAIIFSPENDVNLYSLIGRWP